MTSWILSFFPDSFFYLALVMGLLGITISFVLGAVPFVDQYKIPIQFVSSLIVVFGVWFSGAITVQHDWEQKVAKSEKKALELQIASNDLNTRLTEKINENEKLRKAKEDAEKKIVTNIITQYDPLCKLSKPLIWMHNMSSQDRIPEGADGVDAGTSDVKASELLQTVMDNYNTCYDIREKLISWQKWYKDQKELYEKGP